jgi:hypothetical protein
VRDAALAALEGKGLTKNQRAQLAALLNDPTLPPLVKGSIASALQTDSQAKRQLAAASLANKLRNQGGSNQGGTDGGSDAGGGSAPGGSCGGSGAASDPGSGAASPGGAEEGTAGSPASAGVPGSADPGLGTSTGTQAQRGVKQVTRYLHVKNNTSEQLTIYVQFRTRTEQGTWTWYPADPQQSEEALAFDLAPGQEAALEHEGWRIHASRARIWAVSASGATWPQYKVQDWWLVPETNANGEHAYTAPEVKWAKQVFQYAPPTNPNE